MTRGLVWESVSWRCGADQFRFDIERGGLFATLTAPGRTLTLPMPVWDGLFDALKAKRATKSRSEQQFPPRSRSRWYDGEIAEVSDSFRSGRTIGEIAQSHNRSAYAIEHQLDKLGLISKAGMYGPGHGGRVDGRVEGGRACANGSEKLEAQERMSESSGSQRPIQQESDPPPSPFPGDRWELRDDV
jgi:hypothetical protein